MYKKKKNFLTLQNLFEVMQHKVENEIVPEV